MSSDLVLGIDVATAAVRLVVVDVADGDVVHTVEERLPTPESPHPGELEQDPVHARVARSALRSAMGALGARSASVRAMTVTATSGSVVATDAEGVPRSRALLYADQRGARQAERLSVTTGRSIAPSTTAARLVWLADAGLAEPRRSRLLHLSDLVVADLTGRVVSDTSHARKAGVDPVTARWPADLTAAGIPEGSLPPLVRPGTRIGTVRATVSADVGLPLGVQVVAGMTDGCTAQIAAGAIAVGATTGVLGTTLVLKGVCEQEVVGYQGAVYSHLGPDGHWWPGGASNSGAGVLASHGTGLAADDAAAAALGPSPLVCYPLPGTGERFPFTRPDAVGFLLGGEAATPVERHRARLDGVAFVERLGLARLSALGVASTDHRVVGGGTRSATWTTIRASVLNRPVSRPAEPSSAFGAAVLAAAGWSGQPLVDVAGRLVRIAEVIDPDPGQVDALEGGYRRLLAVLCERGWLEDAAVEPVDVTPAPPRSPREGDR